MARGLTNESLLLLTGVPGVGKTTVIRKAAEALGDLRVGGFYTQEIREGGARKGFSLATFDGREAVMAHLDFPKERQVGRYGVDVGTIDRVIEGALPTDERRSGDDPFDLYIIDEIGKMECMSPRFVSTMRRLFDSGKPIVATIAQRGTGFIAEVKGREDAQLWRVRRDNRDALPERTVDWIRHRTHA